MRIFFVSTTTRVIFFFVALNSRQRYTLHRIVYLSARTPTYLDYRRQCTLIFYAASDRNNSEVHPICWSSAGLEFRKNYFSTLQIRRTYWHFIVFGDENRRFFRSSLPAYTNNSNQIWFNVRCVGVLRNTWPLYYTPVHFGVNDFRQTKMTEISTYPLSI